MNKQQQINKLRETLNLLNAFDGFENFEAICGKGLGDEAIREAMEKDSVARADVSIKKQKVLRAIEFLEQQENLDYCLSL